MQEIAGTLSQYSVVREMKDVREVLSLRLIAETGDVRRFHNGSALVSLHNKKEGVTAAELYFYKKRAAYLTLPKP